MTQTPLQPMHPVLAALDVISGELASLAQVNPSFMRTATKADSLTRIAGAEAQLVELRLRVMAVSDDVAEDAAARDVATWFAHATRTGPDDARADAALAVELDRRWGHVAEGMRAGEVSLAQARVIARRLDQLSAHVDPETLEKAEVHLVECAQDFGPRQLGALGKRVLEIVAPEVAEEVEARRIEALEAAGRRKTRLRLRRNGDGSTHISGDLPDSAATRLAVYCEAWTNPRQRDTHGESQLPDGAEALDGEVLAAMLAQAAETGLLAPVNVPRQSVEPSDPVSRLPHAQRMGQAFCALLEAIDPKRLPIHGGDATMLHVTIGLDQLRSELGSGSILTTGAVPGPGTGTGEQAVHDDLDAMSAGEVRRLACNARILPVVLGGASQILDQGRDRRLFTPAQHRALLLRDRRCRAEGCDVPGTWAEAHHWHPWSHGGRTDLADGVLLCWLHHHRVHQTQAWRAERLPNGDVRFHRLT